ncbi:MAG: esterase/lipase family protein [Solirubrobacterales bacterium]
MKKSFALICAVVSAACVLFATAASAGAQLPVIYSASTGSAGFFSPQTPPPGANDWSCKPSSAHPYPVVLLHGLGSNMGENFGTLSPLLKNNGYCVFALNYGETALSLGRIYGLETDFKSPSELAAFVDRVLAATGAAKVDIVGHSEGGQMPNYYLKFLGGGAKTHALVGLAPDNHGTDVSGLLKLANQLATAIPPLGDVIYGALNWQSPALADQKFDSPYIQTLNSVPDTVPGVKYTVIATKYDSVVTPYRSAFLAGPNVTNITIQDKCALDFSEHIGLAWDHVALREVLNALDPTHARSTVCTPVPPLVGG